MTAEAAAAEAAEAEPPSALSEALPGCTAAPNVSCSPTAPGRSGVPSKARSAGDTTETDMATLLLLGWARPGARGASPTPGPAGALPPGIERLFDLFPE